MYLPEDCKTVKTKRPQNSPQNRSATVQDKKINILRTKRAIKIK